MLCGVIRWHSGAGQLDTFFVNGSSEGRKLLHEMI
jgi:hypothetical protein